ncbi:MAG: acyclic terpene utilization AtuA family protein [Pseudomonadota bacterium]
MIKIGGASGYWGESSMATPQLLAANVDVLIYDYLAEITMSLLAKARMKDASKGYAPDFINTAMAPNLRTIAEQGVKVVSNAGGINPASCAAEMRAEVERQGLDLKVAVVEGDELLSEVKHFAERAPSDMFSEAPFPNPATIVSMNAYLGAFPIAEALAQGADIVITGRVVDSALTLGPLINTFGWQPSDFDRLAAGSLVGHILECGPQATGGNFTDWRDVPDRANIGYPIAEVQEDGSATITKPEGTGGLVTKATIAEQIVYEIGDPGAYLLPDVSCDFRNVEITETGRDRVNVKGAKGTPPPPTLKVCATHVEGWRGGLLVTFYGFEASEKAKDFADCAFDRAESTLRSKNLSPYTDKSIEVLGSGSQFGDEQQADEVVLKIAARHTEQAGITALLKEAAGMGLATAPGLCGFAGGRSKPTPVVKLFSFQVDKSEVVPTLNFGDGSVRVPTLDVVHTNILQTENVRINAPSYTDEMIDVLLIDVAYARSGDKGNDANIGVIARHPDIFPFLWDQLTESAVSDHFSHVLEGKVQRFALPGFNAMNFLLTRSLGGGGIASLRNDPQGKGFSQVMLSLPISIPKHLLAEIEG